MKFSFFGYKDNKFSKNDFRLPADDAGYQSCGKYAGLCSMLTTPLPVSSSPMTLLAAIILYERS